MAYTNGRCTNVDYCSLAAGRRDVEVKIGNDFVCPECAKPLRAPQPEEASRGPGLLLVAGAALLILVGGGIAGGYMLSTTSHTPPPLPQVVLARPAAAPAPRLAEAPKAEETVLLKLAGAPSMAPLAARLAATYLASLGDTGIVTQNGKPANQLLVTGLRLGRPETIAITASGADAGFAALAGKSADIVLSAGRIGQAQLDRLHAPGDVSAPASEHAIGYDAGAVAVNPSNTIASLTLAQLAGILDGHITSWPQIGGTGGAIHLVAASDSAADAFRALVPGAPPVPAGAPRLADAASAVLRDPDAACLLPLGGAGRTRIVPLAAVGAAPALPTQASIADESYPLARPLYFYTAPASANPFARSFTQYALGAEGQAAIAQSGAVPLHAALQAAAAPATPKDRYRALISNATRLAADLHFEPNSNKLDLHSAREVDRVWNFMMSDHSPADHLVLMGFADNQGTPESNLTISQQRAQAVAAVFARRGLPPGQVVAFGSDLPLADNTSEAGRERNRRVEVFLLR